MPHNSEKGRMRTDRQDPRPSLGSLGSGPINGIHTGAAM